MKKYLIFISLFLTLLLISSSALAASESLEALQKNVVAAFNWGLGIAALLTAISFAFGAIQYMVSKVAEGKDRMIGSILGLVLIFVSWMILKTVNPKLVELSLNPLPAGAGIYILKNGDKNDLSHVADKEVADLTELKKQGYTQLYYTCLDKKFSPPELLVWFYKKTNQEYDFDNEENNRFRLVACGGQEDLSNWGSYKMSFMKPGVHFCTGFECEYCSEAYTTSQNDIPAPFGGKLQSVLLVNEKSGTNNSGGIGVMLHDNPDFTKGGFCGEEPIIYSKLADNMYTRKCEASNKPFARSVNIFRVAKDPKSSGSGIGFYTNTTGWKAGVWGGSFLVTPDKIDKAVLSLDPKEDMEFNWLGPDGEELNEGQKEFAKACKSFAECIDPRSMQVNGNYLITVYTSSSDVYGQWCQTFTRDVESFGAQSEIKPEGSRDYDVDKVEIVPIMRN